MAKSLIQMTVLVTFWIIMEFLSFFSNSNELILFFQKSKYLSICFIPPIFYIASSTLSTYPNTPKPFKRLYLFVLPMLSIVSIFTGVFPYKFFSDFKIISIHGVPIFNYHKNIGFQINTLSSYFLILLGCGLLMFRTLNSPKLYQTQSIFIFFGTLLSFGINLLFVTELVGKFMIDSTSIAILSTLIVFYWGIYRLPKTKIVPVARDLIIENINDLVIILDTNQCLIDANPAALKFIAQYGKYTHVNKELKANLNGMKLTELIEYLPNIKVIDSSVEVKDERTLTYQSGEKTFYFTMFGTDIRDIDSKVIGKLYLMHDITLMQEYLNNLEYLNEKLVVSDQIINDTLEGVLLTDIDNNIVRVNNAFERLSGYTRGELLGNNPRILKSKIHDNHFYKEMWNSICTIGFWEGEIWDKKKGGEIYPKWMSISKIYYPNGNFANYLSISSDITKIKKTESALQSLSYYDSLTGIPNRALFYERLERALLKSRRNGSIVALLFMDLDRFKVINDTMGHAAGDLLLIEVARRIKTRIRQTDTVSRLGGDEFTIILEEISHVDGAKAVAEDIISQISAPYFIQEKELNIGVSIGIALSPYDDDTVEGIVRKADASMYQAKETGRGKYSFFSEALETRNRDLLEMQTKIKTALDTNEFELYLQPQMVRSDLGDGFKLIGAEALIRWRTADGTILTPDKFIPISESNGMIVAIGNWVLDEIFKIDTVLKENEIRIKLSINASAQQFKDNSFIERISCAMQQKEGQNIRLGIEITESMLIEDIEKTIELIHQIKNMGIQIALDDFGTGFSSLSYLTHLPIDYLKIDKSFVADMNISEHKNLTSTIISMAKTLNLITIAEGVETIEQIDNLLSHGCVELQGYYFSKPLPLQDFITFAKKYSS